jgi:hypothetical protein
VTLPIDPISEFQADHYIRHNQRLEHLATLGLPLARRSVIEVGAGIGDHTSFFLDQECSVLTLDGTPGERDLLRKQYSWIDVHHLDPDDPDPGFAEQTEVVCCYGALPADAALGPQPPQRAVPARVHAKRRSRSSRNFPSTGPCLPPPASLRAQSSWRRARDSGIDC